MPVEDMLAGWFKKNATMLAENRFSQLAIYFSGAAVALAGLGRIVDGDIFYTFALVATVAATLSIMVGITMKPINALSVIQSVQIGLFAFVPTVLLGFTPYYAFSLYPCIEEDSLTKFVRVFTSAVFCMILPIFVPRRELFKTLHDTTPLAVDTASPHVKPNPGPFADLGIFISYFGLIIVSLGALHYLNDMRNLGDSQGNIRYWQVAFAVGVFSVSMFIKASYDEFRFVSGGFQKTQRGAIKEKGTLLAVLVVSYLVIIIASSILVDMKADFSTKPHRPDNACPYEYVSSANSLRAVGQILILFIALVLSWRATLLAHRWMRRAF